MTPGTRFFATHSPMTDPGRYANSLALLPRDVPALCRIVQGLLIHVFWAEQYGVRLPDERRSELQLRSVAGKLARIMELDARPLAIARPPDTRLVGNCRDFSVLLTALLRQHGIPSRARCGFARYFIPNHYEDHWVCEYWSEAQQRWILVDAQLDALQSAKLQIAFDPLDVPRDQFVGGGAAWRLCRAGAADPETFGIFELKGLGFVRGNLVRDVAALNKVELLPWDCWGMIETPDDALSADDLRLLDEVAEQTSGDVPLLEQVRAAYARDSRLRVPATIRSYTEQGPRTVELEQILA